MTEQPNQNKVIIEKIQGLASELNKQIGLLDTFGTTAEITGDRKAFINQALEDIDMFQKTTLHDMAESKAFE